uniref:Uncharacterized protein n=1 Tax=Arundo donax TaxID=35708 RepID=A0A0A9GM42_ARUDO
MMEKPCSMQC